MLWSCNELSVETKVGKDIIYYWGKLISVPGSQPSIACNSLTTCSVIHPHPAHAATVCPQSHSQSANLPMSYSTTVESYTHTLHMHPQFAHTPILSLPTSPRLTVPDVLQIDMPKPCSTTHYMTRHHSLYTTTRSGSWSDQTEMIHVIGQIKQRSFTLLVRSNRDESIKRPPVHTGFADHDPFSSHRNYLCLTGGLKLCGFDNLNGS